MLNLLRLFLISSILLIQLYANDTGQSSAILTKVEVYKGIKNIKIDEINNTLFEASNKNINVGLTNKQVWVKLSLYNKLSKEINKLAVIDSSHLESIDIYSVNKNIPTLTKSIKSNRALQGTLSPYFKVNLKPNEAKHYYLYIKSSQIPSSFNITLQERDSFIKSDKSKQFLYLILFGIMLTLAVVFAILSIFKKEKSYIYFSMFILVSLFYLFSYSGLANIYASKSYYLLDSKLSIIKLNVIIVLSSLYSILFLKLEKKDVTYKLYLTIIFLALLEILLASFLNFSYYFVLYVSALYAIVNIIAGIVAYLKGLKEARLYIVGMIILAFGIYINIFNALNMNILHTFSNSYILIFALCIFALTLAYVDRLYTQKKEEFNFLSGMLDKKFILDRKIEEKQKELTKLETSEEILRTNVSNLIKNNLHTTLSMLKLQEPKVNNQQTLEHLKSLESKIEAIVKTYTLFLSNNNLKNIDMRLYLNRVINDIQNIYSNKKKLHISTDIDAKLELEEALYISLYVIDYIVNRYQDNLEDNNYINISLKNQDKKYKFSIKESQEPFKTKSNSSFNLKKLFKS